DHLQYVAQLPILPGCFLDFSRGYRKMIDLGLLQLAYDCVIRFLPLETGVGAHWKSREAVGIAMLGCWLELYVVRVSSQYQRPSLQTTGSHNWYAPLRSQNGQQRLVIRHQFERSAEEVLVELLYAENNAERFTFDLGVVSLSRVQGLGCIGDRSFRTI